jgi:CheY-like chemotaxis protein
MARILVIDDEEPVRRLLTRILVADGHEVLEANNGREALEVHTKESVQLVITDIVMPEKDGLEVIMALRHDAPGLRIIAMSGGGRFHQTEALLMAEPLGAVASLRKPFSIDELREAVGRALAA